MAALVTALIAAFIPGASPPEVRTPIVFIFAISPFILLLRKSTKNLLFLQAV
jgi:hypothetical protein